MTPGVKLDMSVAHTGLFATMTATLDSADWQRCRGHYERDVSGVELMLMVGQGDAALEVRRARLQVGACAVRPRL